MNVIINVNTQSMTSLEIAELVEKRHDNVKRTIENLVKQAVITSPQVEEKPTAGRPSTFYSFSGEQGKRDSIIVVAQLCPEFTARLVDRWQELEEVVKQNSLTLPNFADPAEAAIAWAAEYRAKQIAQQERDYAIATKAEIGERREATAMATASAKSREAEKLKEQLGESKNYASIKAVETITGKKFNWRALKKWCTEHGKKIKDIYDANYGSVKTYPKDAWQEVYGIKLKNIFQA